MVPDLTVRYACSESVLKEGVMQAYRRILLAIDFSKETALLCERAVDLAQRFEAALGLIHVIEPVIIDPAYDVLPALPAGIEMELMEHARGELGKLAVRYGVKSENCWVETGATKSQIIQCAEENDFDLIVVGSHGRHGVALLLGATANAVLHGAPCDVLAVRIK